MKEEIKTIFEGLNSAQREAVERFEGPSLIIAGAGSGKTRVLTCRIANILAHGHRAGSVLALTFTNKASREMKERIAGIVGYDVARYLWMGTFHSVFVKFLRESADLLGFPKNFTIYDTADSRSALRGCIKELSLDEKVYKPNEVLSRISVAKNNLITPGAYMANAALIQNDVASRRPKIGEVYSLYHKKCKQAGAMDFDDILLYTNLLFRDFPEELERLRSRFSFILVDEYQDTNYAQYLIIKKLAADHRNICVVGDDAQSIYSFRGARIENILNFKKDYPDAREFRLEQNYRSTRTIVKAANSLIAKNSNQLEKRCFSSLAEGERIKVVSAFTDQEEAFMVASSVLSRIYQDKASYGDFAVLYRTNAQSRAVEEALRKRSLPYKIYGGHSFYERAEVKDMISFLRLLLNKKDDEAFRRIVNVPPRGIGDTTLACLTAAANAEGISLWEAMTSGQMSVMGIKPAAVNRLLLFASMISEISEHIYSYNAYDVAMEVLVKSGYLDYLKSDTSVEGQARLDNVEELMNSIKAFVEEYEEASVDGDVDVEAGEIAHVVSLTNYVENISLLSSVDENNGPEDSNKISLMTVHSAKGLEFPYVYVIGMEENLFPSGSMSGINFNDMEEERRLFYVAITRAKYSVTLSYAQSRFRWGSHVNYPVSRFLKEIDSEYLDWPENTAQTFNPLHEMQHMRNLQALESLHSMPTFHKTADTDFKADPPSKLRVGQKVEHDRFGYGLLLELEGNQPNTKAIVDFEQGGRKTLLLKFAKLRVVE